VTAVRLPRAAAFAAVALAYAVVMLGGTLPIPDGRGGRSTSHLPSMVNTSRDQPLIPVSATPCTR
jgi:hypothetical protein